VRELQHDPILVGQLMDVGFEQIGRTDGTGDLGDPHAGHFHVGQPLEQAQRSRGIHLQGRSVLGAGQVADAVFASVDPGANGRAIRFVAHRHMDPLIAGKRSRASKGLVSDGKVANLALGDRDHGQARKHHLPVVERELLAKPEREGSLLFAE